MIKEQEPRVIKFGPANGSAITRNISVGLVKLPGAIARLIAGPPMTDQSKFKQELAEARARNEWFGLR